MHVIIDPYPNSDVGSPCLIESIVDWHYLWGVDWELIYRTHNS